MSLDMSVDENDNDETVGKMANAFPQTKIKGLIRQEEGIGKVYSSAVDLIATSSAFFIEELSSAAIEIARNEAVVVGERDATEQQPLVITLNHLQQSVTNPTAPLSDYLQDTTTQKCPQKFEFIQDIVKGGYKSIPSYHQIYAKKEATKSCRYSKKRKKGSDDDVEYQTVVDDTGGSPLQNTKLGKSFDNREVIEAHGKQSVDSGVPDVASGATEDEVQATKPYINNFIIQDEEDYD